MTGFIGGGNMAEALIKGLTSRGERDLVVSEPREDRRRYLEQTYRIKTTPSNREVVTSRNIIILAIKPQSMNSVLEEISPFVNDTKTVISIAAGITLSLLKSTLKTNRLVRVMSNTPALVQEGMSVISLCTCLPEKIIAPVRDIFMSIGKVLTLPEKYMNAVTALSGSGPAFIALFIESMIEGGMRMGLSSEDATDLSVQTLLGTARLLDTGMSPEKLRIMVTSPGGTTAAGLKIYEESSFKQTVIDGLLAALKRADELGKGE